MTKHMPAASGALPPRRSTLLTFALCALTLSLVAAASPLAAAAASGPRTSVPSPQTAWAPPGTWPGSESVPSSQTASVPPGTLPGGEPVQSPQTTWAPPGTAPEPDAVAASQVTIEPEIRPSNQAANDYIPSEAQLRAFRSAKGADGETPVQRNHWNAFVTGQDGLQNPSTDTLIQWVAHKWGIPEDWLRALAVYESWWRQDAHGDLRFVPSGLYYQFPQPARSRHGRVFEEMGITQIKWLPNESINWGTEALRWRSTAFALDYMGAAIRFYYDGDCRGCGAGYTAGQQWASIAAWHSPEPWNNQAALSYTASLKAILAARTWSTPAFQRPCAISLSVGQCEHPR